MDSDTGMLNYPEIFTLRNLINFLLGLVGLEFHFTTP
jgi:hypothetical protein